MSVVNPGVAQVRVDDFSSTLIVPVISNPINVSPLVPVSSLALFPSVPENYFKEVLPCELSLLGFHLNSAFKEKISNGGLY